MPSEFLQGEDKLSHLFSENVRNSEQFRVWILRQTKFSAYADVARLLSEEEFLIRPRRFWWRHWWCANIPGCGEKETDIFLVFDTPEKLRFALHIENKMTNSKFTPMQAECYRARGIHMANKHEFLNYSEFETIIISPWSFRIANKNGCLLFDRHVPHEHIARFIPEFGK
jgi:hypothetical protein